MWYKWIISSSSYCMWCSPPSLTLSTIKLLNMSFPIQQYERRCCNWNTMITVEVKFGGQAFPFSPVTAGNPKKYDRSTNDFIRIVHEFIERIKQEAPPTLRNRAIFEMLHAQPIKTLLGSCSFCVNVTRHQPSCYSIQALFEWCLILCRDLWLKL